MIDAVGDESHRPVRQGEHDAARMVTAKSAQYLVAAILSRIRSASRGVDAGGIGPPLQIDPFGDAKLPPDIKAQLREGKSAHEVALEISLTKLRLGKCSRIDSPSSRHRHILDVKRYTGDSVWSGLQQV